MRLHPDSDASKLSEYNYNHDPRNGQFTSGTNRFGHTTLNHPASDFTASVHSDSPGQYKVHVAAPGKASKLHTVRPSASTAMDEAKRFLLNHTRVKGEGGDMVQVEPKTLYGKAGFTVTTEDGKVNVFTQSKEKAEKIQAAVKAGKHTENPQHWLDGLL